MTYLEHTLYDNGMISVCFIKGDGVRYRYCLAPGDSTEGEPSAVQESAAEAWTDAVIASYEASIQQAVYG